MSKLETPMTRALWKEIGGTLVEEFQAVERGANQARRLLDAVIILDGPSEIRHWRDVFLENKDIVKVQTKAERLGMYLMGQTLFSLELIKEFKPRSAKSIALCNRDDGRLRPLLEAFDGCEVIVMPGRSD
jgi:hypothetical protein